MSSADEARNASLGGADTLVGDAATMPGHGATPVPRPIGAPRADSVVSASEPGVDPGGDAPVMVDRDAFFERQDHIAGVARLRRLLPLAIVLWFGFFFVDFVLATWVVPGSLWPYAVLRSVGTLPILVAWLRLRRDPIPSPRTVALLDLTMTSSCAACLTGMCLLSGGLVSPYNSYIPMVLMGRAAAHPNHWKEGAIRLGIPALLNPLVLGGAAALSPAIAAQFSDRIALGTFFFYIMLINGAWLLLVIAGHNAWALRRQVFRSRSIGRYRLESRLGRGGMGEVWAAFHDQLRRKVALKILQPESGTDPRAVARFEREIMATAALTHPNTIRIYDHGVTDDGLWFYAMELLTGDNLSILVRREGPLPPARAVHLIEQAARALGEAHAHGIIHRDIKPENIHVTTLGGEVDFVKVLDFGIARLEDDADAVNLTSTGAITGTPAYLSPEAISGKQVDARADVYGLGGTLYYALTGTMPHQGNNAREMLFLHLEGELERPSERLGRPLPEDLEAIVVRCLAKDPAGRPVDARVLAGALARCRSVGDSTPQRSVSFASPASDERAVTQVE